MFSDLESLNSLASKQKRALSSLKRWLPPAIYTLNTLLILLTIPYISSAQDCAKKPLGNFRVIVVVLNAVAIAAFGFFYVLARFWRDVRSSEPQDRQVRIWPLIESSPVPTVQSASTPRRPGTAPAVAPAASGAIGITPLSEVVTPDVTSTLSSISSSRSGSTQPVASNGGPDTTRDSSISSTNALPPNGTRVVGAAQAPKPSGNTSIASRILPIPDDSPTIHSGEQTVSRRSLQAFLASKSRALPPHKSSTAKSTGSDHSIRSTSPSDEQRVSPMATRHRTPGISTAGGPADGSAAVLPRIRKLGSIHEGVLPQSRVTGDAESTEPAYSAAADGGAPKYRTAESFSRTGAIRSSQRSTPHHL